MAKIDLEIDQGTTWSQSFSLVNIDETIYTTDGYSVVAQLRHEYSSSNVIAFTSNVANGIVSLSLTSNQTANLIYDTYVYDVFLMDPANNVSKPFGGYITVNFSATKL